VDGKLPKLFFMTQVGTRPPSFVIKTNTDRDLHFSYQRYLENQLREAFGFTGTPIRFAFRKREKSEGEDQGVAKVRRILDPGEGLKPRRQREPTAARGASRRPREAREAVPPKAPARPKAAVQAEAPARPRPAAAAHPARPKQPKRAVTRPRGKTGPRKGTPPRSGKATARPVRAPRKRSS
jgi:GTP-binding protein